MHRNIAVLIGSMMAMSAARPFDFGAVFTDPVDKRMDASQWLLSRHGFLPLPIIITEPAVGHGGGTVRFTGGAGAASVNLKYYGGEERPRLSDGIAYDIEGWGALAQVVWGPGKSDFWLGPQLIYMDATTELRGGNSSVPDLADLQGKVQNSGAGAVLTFDGRDNRVTTEFEARYALDPRWSAVTFVGVGRAADSTGDLNDEPSRWSGGVGGRYLIARLLGLQVGIDVARGPEEWAFYIQMGNGWSL